MRISDKNLGYLVLAALLLLFLLISLLMWNKQRSARDTVFIRFQQLGSLQPEDPVTIRGFRVGKISTVHWDPQGAALVTISLDAPRIFRTGTEFRNESYSLMGQRRLAIEPNQRGDLTPAEHVFQGTFEPGIAEALHLMEMVKEQTILVRNIALLLQHGNDTTASLAAIIENLLEEGDAVTEKADAAIGAVRPVVKSTLQQAQQMSRQAIQVSRQADSTIQSLHGEITLGITDARQLIVRLHTVLASLDLMLQNIESHPVTHSLLYKRDLIDQIEGLTQTLQLVLSKIDRHGFVILDEKGKRKSMVKFRNINLLGKTAREKARERENNQ